VVFKPPDQPDEIEVFEQHDPVRLATNCYERVHGS